MTKEIVDKLGMYAFACTCIVSACVCEVHGHTGAAMWFVMIGMMAGLYA